MKRGNHGEGVLASTHVLREHRAEAFDYSYLRVWVFGYKRRQRRTKHRARQRGH